jgi:hypothetical protein
VTKGRSEKDRKINKVERHEDKEKGMSGRTEREREREMLRVVGWKGNDQ